MRAGKFDRTIVLERSVPEIAPSGSVSNGRMPFATARAEIVQQSATEFLTGYGEAESGSVIFRIRYLPGITTADRVSYNGAAYDLKEITEIGRRRGLELRAVATS